MKSVPKARIVFFGTPEFAASQLQAIIEAGHQVVCVVTAADKPAGRGKKIRMSAVKELAIENNLPLEQPSNLKDGAFVEHLKSLDADIFIVVAFRMMPAVVWKIPRLGTFNLHASLLPNYRGAAPINHAIMNGEPETGLTTFFINEAIDEGGILLQQTLPIGKEEDAGTLHDRLMKAGNQLVVDTIAQIMTGKAIVRPQSALLNPNISIKSAPKIFREDCAIRWDLSLDEIHNQIRGLSPYPAAYTTFVSSTGEHIEVKVFRSEKEKTRCELKPKLLLTDNRTYLKVALPDGFLHLLQVQQAGKKSLDIADFLKGKNFKGTWMVQYQVKKPSRSVENRDIPEFS